MVRALREEPTLITAGNFAYRHYSRAGKLCAVSWEHSSLSELDDRVERAKEEIHANKKQKKEGGEAAQNSDNAFEFEEKGQH
jgi:hypothetical protein